jgi:hypothetical protein
VEAWETPSIHRASRSIDFESKSRPRRSPSIGEPRIAAMRNHVDPMENVVDPTGNAVDPTGTRSIRSATQSI